jgi:hypothetical protein
MAVLRHRHTASGAGSRIIVLYFPFRQISPLSERQESYRAGRLCAPMPRTCSNADSSKLDYRRTIHLTLSGRPASRIFWKMTVPWKPLKRIAGHADSRTTKLYDRRGQKVLLEDMERIRY